MPSVSVRSYLAAGVAAVGVGAVALAPVHPLTAHLAVTPTQAAELAVDLAAAVDPITPLVDLVQATGDNLIALVDNWSTGLYVGGTIPMPDNTGIRPGGVLPNNNTFNGNLGWRTGGYEYGGPLPIVQQVVGNTVTYLGELPEIGAIAGQVFANIGNALRAPIAMGVNEIGRFDGATGVGLGPLEFNQNVNATPYVQLPVLGLSSQRDVWALLPTLAPQTVAAIGPVLDFATSPISGVLLGAIGPIVGPVISLVNSVNAIVGAIGDSDWAGALNELINIPANAVNAFLNGGPNLDVTGLLNALDVPLPSTITKVGLQMGGLLSPGGVAFDALSTEAEILGIGATVPGLPVGPIGSLIGLASYIATAIKVTPPAPTASARAAAAAEAQSGTLPDATAERAPQPPAADPEPVAPTALSADRAAADTPAPVKQRQSRKAAGDTGGLVSSAGVESTPKASAARRASR